ncbi:hypothetical protein BH23VER1_BH23VER1_00220 [soil metagenome]
MALAVAISILAPAAASGALLLYYDFEDGTDATIDNLGSLATSGSLIAASGDASDLFGDGAPAGSTPNSGLLINGKAGDLIETNLSAEALSFYEPAPSALPNDGLPSTYTAAAWARLDAPSGDDDMIFGQVTAPPDSTGFLHNGFRHTAATSGFNRVHLGHWANDSTGTANIQTGQWVHVTYRVSNGSRSVFVNGVRDNTPSAAGAGGLRNDSNIVVGVTQAVGSTTRGFVGALDEIVVFDEALSQNQVTYLAAGGDPLELPQSVPILYTAPTGPGGTWNLYQPVAGLADGQAASWWNAHNIAIATPDPTGITSELGHLVSVADMFENTVVRIVASGQNIWLGGTDNDTAFTMPPRSEGTFFWANATSNSGAPDEDPFTFTRWAGGEPNNFIPVGGTQTGEDAVEMRTDGFWNDNQSGIPGTGESEDGSVVRAYVIEWDTAAAEPVPGAIEVGAMLPEDLPGSPGNGEFFVRQLSGLSPTPSIYAASSAIEQGQGIVADGTVPYINLADPENPGSRGYFPGDFAFPGDTPADDNRFVTIAKAQIEIDLAGDYTFGVFGDDGYALRIRGEFWTSANGSLFIDPFDPSTVGSPFGGGTGLAIINLAEGTYDIELVHYEGTGGAQLELFAAPGSFTNRTQSNAWRPVGYTGSTINFPILTGDWEGNTTEPGASPTQITNTGQADTALATLPLTPFSSSVINFTDPESGGSGFFTPNDPFPNDTGIDDNDFALEATGVIQVPADGLYMLGFRGDDGSYLDLTGATFLSASQSGGGLANGNARLQFGGTTADSFTSGTVFLMAGVDYPVRVVYFERAGGAFFEVFGGQGFAFELLGSQGAAPVSDPFVGLSLVGAVETELFQITGITFDGAGRPVITFTSSDTETYTIERSTDLVTWITIDVGVPGTSMANTTSYTDESESFDPGQPRYFYRVTRE